MKKKLFYPILFIILVMSLLFVGCGGGSGELPKELTFGKTSYVMELNDSEVLSFVIRGGTRSEIVWSSSDENVVKVNDGTLTAVGIGTATVTAKFGDVEYVCHITVSGTTSYPIITVDASEINLAQGEEYEISASISQGGDPIDTPLLWKTSNANVATVANGVVTAVGVGSAEITVYTADNTASKVIIVNVIDGHLFSINSDDVVLNRSVVNSGDKVVYDLTYSAFVDGTPASGSVVWTSQDETVATVSESGRITRIGAGNTTVKGEFTFADGAKRTATVNVSVEKSVCYEKIGDLGIAQDEFNITAAMLSVNGVDNATVTFRGNNVESSVTGDTITIDTTPLKNELLGKNTTLTVELEDRIVECEVFVVSRVLRTKQDVLDFLDTSSIRYETGNETSKSWVYDGYYTLGNDIDMEGYAGQNTLPFSSSTNHNANGMADYGFQGIFDGRGYAISNLTINGQMGFFGSVGRTATVKNVEFKSCKLNIHTSGGRGLLGYAFNGKLENVLIDLVGIGAGKYAGAIACRTNTYAYISGVVVKFVYNGTADNKYIGVLGFRNMAPETDHVSSLYVITNLPEIAAFGYEEDVGATPVSYNNLATIYESDATDMSFNLSPEAWKVDADGSKLPELKNVPPITLSYYFTLSLSNYDVQIDLKDNSSKEVTYEALRNGEDVAVTAAWYSADNTVATVNDGVITAVSEGETSVVVTVTDANGNTRNAVITVLVLPGTVSGDLGNDSALYGHDIEW